MRAYLAKQSLGTLDRNGKFYAAGKQVQKAVLKGETIYHLRKNLALNATVLYYNREYPDYAKNGPQHAFDGKKGDPEADKWHASGVNCWVAFDIHTPVTNPILKIYHAGSAGEDSNLNTSSWDVYILNERYLTEEAYFNMDRSTQNRVCQIAWFWKRIHVTTGNTADISIDHIDMPEARRLFKINMRKTNQTGYPYYLNVYEIEMYESDY